MEVILRATNERVQEVIERDLYWYDTYTGDMLYGRGSHLNFVYSSDLKRSVPVVEKHPQWVMKNNFAKINDWVSKNKGRYHFAVEHSVPNHYVIINLNDDYFETVSHDLRNLGIVHDEY